MTEHTPHRARKTSGCVVLALLALASVSGCNLEGRWVVSHKSPVHDHDADDNHPHFEVGDRFMLKGCRDDDAVCTRDLYGRFSPMPAWQGIRLRVPSKSLEAKINLLLPKVDKKRPQRDVCTVSCLVADFAGHEGETHVVVLDEYDEANEQFPPDCRNANRCVEILLFCVDEACTGGLDDIPTISDERTAIHLGSGHAHDGEDR